jgi:predicted nucleic-acid-binding protein
MTVVDTDVLVRYLTGDDIKKAERFRDTLQAKKKLCVSDVVVIETFFVLSSYYKFPKSEVLSWLSDLIRHPSIQCNQPLLEETFAITAKHNISIADGYSAALARKQASGRLMSYDKALGKSPGIKRLEP